MTPAFLTGLDMLRQMQALTGCCDTQPPVIVYRDRPGLSQPAAAVPDGWAMVPKEPTPEMIRSFAKEWHRPFESTMKSALLAMLAAAPQAPQQAEPWRPIETVPKDELYSDGENRYGPRMLVWANGYDEPLRARWWWRTDSDACNFIADGGYAVFPTCWMPLPAPPATPVA